MKQRAKYSWIFGPLLIAVIIAASSGQSGNPYAPDTPEAGSVEAIAKFTTEACFVSPWVAYVPESATVPSPTRYLGHIVGAEGELTSPAKI